MLPPEISQMTKTDMQMLGCEYCHDSNCLHKALMEWCNKRVGPFNSTLNRLDECIFDLEQQHPDDQGIADDLKDLYLNVLETRDGFIEDVFIDGPDSEQKHKKMRDAAEEFTCGKCGDTEFVPYWCCIGRCNGCPDPPVP